MKKTLILLFALMLLSVSHASAYSYKVDGIYYEFSSDGTATVTNMEHSKGDIVIPSSITYYGMTYKVTNIGTKAFYCCSGLTSVIIPNSVTSIGTDAFSGCSGLTSVIIPNSVTSIGTDAFYCCSGLTSVIIPNSVTSIGAGAFSGCSGLKSVTIGSGVTSIEESVFGKCNNVSELIYADGCTTAIRTYITSITTVIIPNSVSSIGNYAFSRCSGLTSVIIPNSVTRIGAGAFFGCTGMTFVNIPNNVTKIEDSTFSNCSGLTSVIIPNSVTSIGECAFFGCSGLKSITIPNSVTSIEGYAFYDCKGLTSITVPSSVTSIGEYAFNKCSGLTSATIDNGKIAQSAFSECTGLTSVTIGSGVTKVSRSAFYYCYNLTDLTINSGEIEEKAFNGCSQLTSVTIGHGVTSLGKNFAECESLFSVSINCDVEEEAFSYCRNLAIVTIGNEVTSIGRSCFSACDALTSVTIGNSVTTIGDCAFSGTGMTSITIPESVTSIGRYAFHCMVSSVTNLAKKPQTISSDTFYKYGTLHVRKGCSYDYSIKEYWKNFTIEGDYIMPTEIQLSQSTYTCAVSDTIMAEAHMLPEDASRKAVIWSSENPEIATVDFNTGQIIGMSKGQTTITATAADDKNVTATAVVKVTDTMFTITATSANTTMGTVTGGGTYEEGKTVTLTATPKSGYRFVKWSDGSTANPYTFKATKNVTLTATFEKIPPTTYTITATSANTSMGTVTGGGTYEEGKTVTLTATPKSGYKFVKWSDGSTKNPYTFTATKNVTLTATFEAIQYTVSATSADASMGTVSGGGTYKHGATVTLTATPKSGYKFVKWSDGTTKNPYTFTATKNVTLTANFMPLTDGVSVTTTDNGQQTITFDMQGRRQDSDVRGLIIQQRKKVLKH